MPLYNIPFTPHTHGSHRLIDCEEWAMRGRFATIYTVSKTTDPTRNSEKLRPMTSLIFDLSEWPCWLSPIIGCQWVWWYSGRIPLHSLNLIVHRQMYNKHISVTLAYICVLQNLLKSCLLSTFSHRKGLYCYS